MKLTPSNTICPLISAGLIAFTLVNGASGNPPTSVPSPADEVAVQILRTPVGAGTLADFNYPEEYLRRVASRLVRSSFEERFRVVVADYRPTTRSVAPPLSELLGHKESQIPRLIAILVVGFVMILATAFAAKRLSKRPRP